MPKKDILCHLGGCYMFSPGSPERKVCEQRCYLEANRTQKVLVPTKPKTK